MTTAKGLGADVSTEGYSLAGLGGATLLGGVIGGAAGGAFWGGREIYRGIVAARGNAAAAANGQSPANAANEGAAPSPSAEQAAKPNATPQPEVLDVPEPAQPPAPKATPKTPPKSVVVQGPKVSKPPQVVPEEPPVEVHNPKLTAETDQWQPIQSKEGWKQAHDASWSRTKHYVPEKAVATLSEVDRTGAAPAGYSGGRQFMNDGRGGGQVLPPATPKGEPIIYREWDVNPYQRGVNRGAERLITGSDGSAYFTSDHYTTFRRMR